MKFASVVLVAAAWVAAVPPAAGATEPAQSPEDLLNVDCGPFRSVELTRLDYRLRLNTPEVAKGVGDLDRYHTVPAVQEMRKPNPYPGNVVANLDFSLRHSPNHHEALRALIGWELKGGTLLEYPKAACYLGWAHRFVPDDETVLLYGGNYFWKSGDARRAQAWYEGALEQNPQSADAHYNLGLLLFERRDFEGSRKHAQLAYAAGFPLTGLRDKLAKAGHPIAPLTAEPAVTKP